MPNISIPPDVFIKTSLKPGTVYYFPEESFSSKESHYFVVLNRNPLDEHIILLVCSQSHIEKVKQRRKTCPPETLVEISKTQYPSFTTNSIIDCNYVLEKTVAQLMDKYAQGKLQLILEPIKDEMVERLRKAVLLSPRIEPRIKNILK